MKFNLKNRSFKTSRHFGSLGGAWLVSVPSTTSTTIFKATGVVLKWKRGYLIWDYLGAGIYSVPEKRSLNYLSPS